MCADRIPRISPSPISGFPEWTPAERLLEQQMIDQIRAAFERYGFSPIETPAVERNAVLTAKGGDAVLRRSDRFTALRDFTRIREATLETTRFTSI